MNIYVEECKSGGIEVIHADAKGWFVGATEQAAATIDNVVASIEWHVIDAEADSVDSKG